MIVEFLDWTGWRTLTLVACWLGLALAASFVVRYHVRSGGAWHRTSEGRWMLYGRVLIASIMGLTLVNYYFRGYTGQRFVSFLFFTAYVLHLWWPHVLLSRAQRDQRDTKLERIANDRDSERS